MKGTTLVADENIALSAVKALRDAGIRVIYISEERPGGSDVSVLRRACDADATLLSFDRDYGELIFRRGHAAPPSVIYLRDVPSSPVEMANVVQGLLNGRVAGDIIGQFVVWTREGVRKRAFPRSG